MGTFDIRDVLKAQSSASATYGSGPGQTNRRSLHPLAERLAAIPVRPTLSPIIVEGAVRLCDSFAVLLTGAALYGWYVADVLENAGHYLYTIPAMTLGMLVVFQSFQLYQVGIMRSLIVQGLRMTAAWTVLFMLALVVFFFLKIGDQVSRFWLAAYFVIGLILLLLDRLVLTVIVRKLTRSGRIERRTAIVGGAESGAALIRALEAQRDTGLRVCGVFDDRGDDRSPDLVAGYPKLGTVDDLVEFARRTRLDLVIFTLPISAETRLLQMLRKLWVLPIDIRLSAHMSKLKFRPRSYSYIGAVPVLDVFDRPIADWDIVMKWFFDKIVGLLALVMLSPLMLITAVAIKLDSRGPVFFRQKRYGFNNELIEVFKFRSMYADKADASASKLVTRDDPRVTRVGRFIRKTSIDELPQLFNVVFAGNLSLVGPRPHAVHAKAEDRFYDEVVDGYFARHKVKPGITGWAQVNGWRGETDTEDKIQRRVEHDIFYIENWSVLFDLFILIKTPFSLLKTEHAY
jgi:Undecaprenyl-phosphate glucose phosphotransferase